MAAQQFILHESASGFALFEVAEAEAVALGTAAGSSSVEDLARFSGAVKLKGMHAFSSAENALSNINDISEGVLSVDLRAFLERSLPSARKVRAARERGEGGRRTSRRQCHRPTSSSSSSSSSSPSSHLPARSPRASRRLPGRWA